MSENSSERVDEIVCSIRPTSTTPLKPTYLDLGKLLGSAVEWVLVWVRPCATNEVARFLPNLETPKDIEERSGSDFQHSPLNR